MYKAGDSFSLTFDIPEYRGATPHQGVVAHYTSPESAVQILGSGTFWATNAMYLNDSRELSHGADRVREWWAAHSSSFEFDLRDLMDSLLPLVDELFATDRFFVLSASNELEDVSQFERYGPVAIQLDSRAVLYPPTNRPAFPNDLKIRSLAPAWRSVAYDDVEKNLRIESYFRQVAAHIQSKPGWVPQKNEILTDWYGWWYSHLIAGMKDRRFRAEAEVRYLVMTELAFDDVRSRGGEFGDTPYVALEHLKSHDDHLPLPVTELIVSPRIWSPTIERDLRDALESAGIPATVRASDVPLR